MLARHFLLLVALASFLAGCASTPPVRRGIALDGLAEDHSKHVRRDPRLKTPSFAIPDPNAEKEKVLAALRPYSAEWVVLYNQIEAEEERRLKTKLVICRGCFPGLGADYTGSIASQGQRQGQAETNLPRSDDTRATDCPQF
jgi:hypothetical protein